MSNSDHRSNNIMQRFPFSIYVLCLFSLTFGIVLFPQPLYWIHGGEFDFMQLMGQTVANSGVELRTSALIPLLRAVSTEPVLVVMVCLSALPTLVALVLVSFTHRWSGLCELVARLRPWCKQISWQQGVRIWGQAIAFMVVLQLSLYVLRYLLGGDIREQLLFNQALLSAAIFWLLLEALFLNQGALLEELGIRGYAQPLLNKALKTPLLASIALGVFWALFHIPRDIAFNTIASMGLSMYLMYFFLFSLWCIGGSIIIGYFFNKTGGSALVAIAIHGLLNDSWRLGGNLDSVPVIEMLTRSLTVFAFALILVWFAGSRLGVKDQV